MMWSIYEIIHFWTAVVDESEESFCLNYNPPRVRLICGTTDRGTAEPAEPTEPKEMTILLQLPLV